MAVTINETSWPQLQRLRFIERQLLWEREVTAAMLVGAFGITRPEAQDAIYTYREFAPENLRPYAANDRSYKPSPVFKPRLIPDSADSLITIARLSTPVNPDFHSVPVLSRSTAPGALATILSAIENRSRIEAVYVSMQNPTGATRTITPCAIISASNRLHVRAYCWDRKAYRDFVLSRFRGTLTLQGDGGEVLPADNAWEESVYIRLVVNDALSGAQQQLVREDFDLVQLEAFEIRKALVGYFLQANLLPTSEAELREATTHPERFPVMAVTNSGESVVHLGF